METSRDARVFCQRAGSWLVPEKVRPRGLHRTSCKYVRGVLIAVRVCIIVVGGRAVPVVVGPQVVADLVYVRQAGETVDVDNGVCPLFELRIVRVCEDVPGGMLASAGQTSDEEEVNLCLLRPTCLQIHYL